MHLGVLDLDLELRDQVTPALWAWTSPGPALQGLHQHSCTAPGDRKCQGRLSQETWVNRVMSTGADNPGWGECPEEEELSVGPSGLRR